jgi:hypothetical protein
MKMSDCARYARTVRGVEPPARTARREPECRDRTGYRGALVGELGQRGAHERGDVDPASGSLRALLLLVIRSQRSSASPTSRGLNQAGNLVGVRTIYMT